MQSPAVGSGGCGALDTRPPAAWEPPVACSAAARRREAVDRPLRTLGILVARLLPAYDAFCSRCSAVWTASAAASATNVVGTVLVVTSASVAAAVLGAGRPSRGGICAPLVEQPLTRGRLERPEYGPPTPVASVPPPAGGGTEGFAPQARAAGSTYLDDAVCAVLEPTLLLAGNALAISGVCFCACPVA